MSPPPTRYTRRPAISKKSRKPSGRGRRRLGNNIDLPRRNSLASQSHNQPPPTTVVSPGPARSNRYIPIDGNPIPPEHRPPPLDLSKALRLSPFERRHEPPVTHSWGRPRNPGPVDIILSDSGSGRGAGAGYDTHANYGTGADNAISPGSTFVGSGFGGSRLEGSRSEGSGFWGSGVGSRQPPSQQRMTPPLELPPVDISRALTPPDIPYSAGEERTSQFGILPSQLVPGLESPVARALESGSPQATNAPPPATGTSNTGGVLGRDRSTGPFLFGQQRPVATPTNPYPFPTPTPQFNRAQGTLEGDMSQLSVGGPAPSPGFGEPSSSAAFPVSGPVRKMSKYVEEPRRRSPNGRLIGRPRKGEVRLPRPPPKRRGRKPENPNLTFLERAEVRKERNRKAATMSRRRRKIEEEVHMEQLHQNERSLTDLHQKMSGFKVDEESLMDEARRRNIDITHIPQVLENPGRPQYEFKTLPRPANFNAGRIQGTPMQSGPVVQK